MPIQLSIRDILTRSRGRYIPSGTAYFTIVGDNILDSVSDLCKHCDQI